LEQAKACATEAIEVLKSEAAQAKFAALAKEVKDNEYDAVKRMHKEVLLEKRVLKDAFMKQKYACMDGGDVQHVFTDMCLIRDLNSEDKELAPLLEEMFGLMPSDRKKEQAEFDAARAAEKAASPA